MNKPMSIKKKMCGSNDTVTGTTCKRLTSKQWCYEHPDGKKKLSVKEKRFIEQMANPAVKSQTQAAKNAGYSVKNAKQIANENLTKPYILDAIQKRKQHFAEAAGVNEKNVLGATVVIAFGDIADALDDRGCFDYEKAKQTGATALIKRITRNDTKYGENVSVEFYSKADALGKLGEYLGMKQQERKNQTDIQKIAEVVKSYLVEHPDYDREQVINIFATKGQVEPEEVSKYLN